MSNIERREFLKLIGAGSVGVGAGFALGEANKSPVEFLVPYPIPPEEFSPGIATLYNSVCTMCQAGCGITVRTREGRAKKIEGNPLHPVNQGRLCALGQAGLQALYNPDRITAPLLQIGDRGSDAFVETTWGEGIARLTNQLGQLDDRSGVVLLSEGVNGHLAGLFELLMTELGSDRLLHYDFEYPEALHAANERLFGEQQLPYYDLENSTYLLSFGADFLGNWLSPVHYGLGFGKSRQDGAQRGHYVQIEPRMSLSGAAADEWLPAAPGTEGILALGIARELVAKKYSGADKAAWARALESYTLDYVAAATDVAADTVNRLAHEFMAADAALAIGGGAASGSSNGVDALIAVNALNYLVGNIGKSGGVVFNPPRAFGATSKTQRAGYQQMAELADSAMAGEIDVLIINSTNPVFTLPPTARFEEAMGKIPLIVSLSSFMDETTALADVVLPSHTYLESWGDHTPDPGVAFPVAAISQPVVAPLYNTRSTGDIMLSIAQQLGFSSALPWKDMETYLQDRWRSLYAKGAAGAESFESFWQSVLQSGVWGENSKRDSGPARLVTGAINKIAVAPPEHAGASDEFPFVLHPYPLNSIRDGRGANLPWLQELPDPMTSIVYGSWVEINPVTATELGVADGDVVSVESPGGTLTAPIFIYQAIRPDVIAIPIGQGHSEYGRYAKDRGVNPLQILAPQEEPVTGAVALTGTRVKLVPTGRRVELVKTGGVSRELGRGIVQTTGGSHENADHSAKLKSIPITVEPA